MQTRTKVLAALGFTLLLLALTFAWRLLPGPDEAESVSAEQPDCVNTSLLMIDSGETELGRESLEFCLRRNPSLNLRLKSGENDAAAQFDTLMDGWSPPWPDNDGNSTTVLTPPVIGEKLSALESYLEKFPTGYHARLAVTIKALILYNRQKYPACQRWLHENENNTALPDFSLYLSALSAWKAGHSDTAAAFLSRLEDVYPESPFSADALITAAKIMMERGDYAEAARKARKAAIIALTPSDKGRALLFVSDAMIASGDRPAHVDAVLDIARAYPDADTPEFLETYIDPALDKLSTDQLFVLANYFNARGRGYPIIKYLSPVSKQLSAEGVYLLANGYYLSGDYEKTLKLRQKLESSGISDELKGRSCMLLANIYNKRKKWDDALKQYAACAKKYAALSGEAYERSAKIHLIKEDEKSQATALEKLVAADPSNKSAPEYLLLVGRKYLVAGDMRNAERFYEIIASDFPESYPAAEAFFWLGKLAYGRHDYESAENNFKESRKRFPYSYFFSRSADYLRSMGIDHDDMGGFLLACRSHYSISSAENSLLKSGNALRHMNVYEPALLIFRLASKNNPNEAASGAARVLRDSGNITLSIKTIEERAKVDPVYYSDIISSPYLTELLFPTLFIKQVSRESAKYNMDPAWPISIIRQESRFKFDAKSSSNALGLMQIIPSTGKWLAGILKLKYPGNSGMFDPDTNIMYGTWYFNNLLEMKHIHGEPALALAAYNGGPGNVRRWLEKFGNDDLDIFIEKMPRAETRGYVKKVMLNFYAYEAILESK